jgi:thiol-disulfide isomerase/thioredoxin
MKKLLFAAITLIFTQAALAQQAEVSRDAEGNKVLKGFISRQELATDTSFAWFPKNQKDYTPYPAALQALKQNKDSVNIIAFGGTWCHDTQFILPKFFVLADAAGLSPNRITVIGVDHNKQTIQHLSDAFHITNVPTIIVMKNGKEIGRVIEYGKKGMFDMELGEILKSAQLTPIP